MVRQIIPLAIRHTFSLGTNDIPLLQAPRLSHTLGAPGPKPQAAPQLVARAAETALGVSFNAQSQAPDIPGISTLNALSIYTGSFNAQSKAPDISSRASKEELSASFNAQDQAPDDPCYDQDSQWFSYDDVFSTLSPLSQVFPWLPSKGPTDPRQTPLDLLYSVHQNPVRIPPSILQANSRKEFNEHVSLSVFRKTVLPHISNTRK